MINKTYSKACWWKSPLYFEHHLWRFLYLHCHIHFQTFILQCRCLDFPHHNFLQSLLLSGQIAVLQLQWMIACFRCCWKFFSHGTTRDTGTVINPFVSQPSASDTQVSALIAGGGCSPPHHPQVNYFDKPPLLGQAGSGCPPQLTSLHILDKYE